MLLNSHQIPMVCSTSTRSSNTISSSLGTILFAVTGGAQTANKKVYMIDARTGDILTSFESKPVSQLNCISK